MTTGGASMKFRCLDGKLAENVGYAIALFQLVAATVLGFVWLIWLMGVADQLLYPETSLEGPFYQAIYLTAASVGVYAIGRLYE
ncbi:hypothetical protein [Natrialba asiatica]|uniref:Uncharacterized protein n=1 Tax=Natrialba asiatica (strain ATCC 700177 / DSM 12278 / JCM 9576 / FERM P-10747 / NBRC 102637 / 172P1) TaxID=29540 RepID=M0B3W5_NATA1|nr:hypothetical protein [Natrialba asiatica]ELZ04933.1 hypothetical protein C481_03232 [Natrialba asiatica DSM 12278]